MTEEELKVGDYVQYDGTDNTKYGTVIAVDSSGYTVRIEGTRDNAVVGLGPGSVTKVQRAQ